MTKRKSRNQGAKLLAGVMVIAMAFAGVSFIVGESMEVDGDPLTISDSEALVSTISSAADDVTIKLGADLVVPHLWGGDGVMITILGDEKTLTFNGGDNHLSGSFKISNITLVGDSEYGVMIGGIGDGEIAFTDVDVEGDAIVYDMSKFSTKGCTFNGALQIQSPGAGLYSLIDTDVEHLVINAGEEKKISSQADSGASILIDEQTGIKKFSAIYNPVTFENCTVKINEICNYAEDGTTYPCETVVRGNGADLRTISGGPTQPAPGIPYVDTVSSFTNTITLGDGAVVGSSTKVIASSTQEVIISGDVTVVDGGLMDISGKLTILENASLTVETSGKVLIQNSGMVDVEGDLVIEGAGNTDTDECSFEYKGGHMSVSGSVSIEGSNAFRSTGVGIEISGLFEVGDESTADLAGATITKDGVLSVNGIVEGSVTNNGRISIDSQGFDSGSSNLTIQLGEKGVVDIINVYGTVEVSDGTNKIELKDIAGVKVTETVEKSGDTETRTLDLAGTIIAAVNFDQSDLTGKIAITQGKVATSGDVVLGDKVGMTISGGTELTVTAGLISEYTVITTTTSEGTDDGTTATSPITGDGMMTVAGKVTARISVGVVTVNAAMYQSASPAYCIYTTLETALTDGATNIALKGTNSIDVDATIPVGTTVTMDSGSKLTIEDKTVLTVAADDRNSARFDTEGTDSVKVNGTLVVVNSAKSKVDEESILSDTSKVSDKSITYTNIYNALAEASEGETVTVRATEVTLSKDLVIENGVTLSIPIGKTLTVDNGVTVTVNGTVYATGGYALAPESEDGSEAAAVTVVNGLFLYTSGTFSDKIVGAYFQYIYSVNNSTVAAIAPLASVPGVMDKVRSDITLNGKMAVSTVDFSAYDGEQRKLIAGGELTFDELTLGPSVEFVVTGNVKVNGSIVLANGSVDVKNVVGFSAYNETDAEDVTTSYFVGNAIALYTDEDATVKGSISFDGAVTLGAGSVDVPMNVPKGATVTIQSGDYDGKFTVEGTVIIDGTEIEFEDLTVFGTVSAKDEGISAEAVRLFVGVTSDDFAKAGTGSVTGVKIVTGSSGTRSVDAPPTGVAYVSPNANVELTNTDLDSTEYYVDGALYLTAYAISENNIRIDEVELTLEDVWFGGWSISEGNTGVIGSPAKVDAILNYNIFSVQVVVDSGIGTVAIDGNVLVNASGNVFTTAALLKAGQHTVTYTLKSGYTGEAVLSVNGDGATVSGMNFSVSGTPETKENKMVPIGVQLSLLGTAVSDTPSIVIPSQPAESDEDMGLTEYLLIVLVILAAILVIVVAVRMMRS